MPFSILTLLILIAGLLVFFLILAILFVCLRRRPSS